MSSSESEDENLKKFAESMDITIFSSKLYNIDEKQKTAEVPKEELKSQRFIEEDENIFHSEINVSAHMQTFIGKKLSALIEGQVEFVEVKDKKAKGSDKKIDRVRLLSDSTETVKFIDAPLYVENRTKVAIKRRNADKELEPDEVEKVKQSAVDPEAVAEEVRTWNKKAKHEPFEYKTSKGIGYLKDPANEFTSQRNKNMWSESKIKTAKKHSKPLPDLIER